MAAFRQKAGNILRWLLLLSIPAVWCALAQTGTLDFLESKFLDWRFHYRGEIDAPVKVIYVDVDSRSLDEIGGWPWSRSFLAEVAAALVEHANVRAVGIDFLLSRRGMSQEIDRKLHVRGDVALAKFLFPDPPIVLAAGYAGAEFRDINGTLRTRKLPLVQSSPEERTKSEPPEVPELEISFDAEHPKLWTPDNVGLIDTYKNGTRVVPAYVPESANMRRYFHMAVELARLYWDIEPAGVKIYPDRITFEKSNGDRVATLPLIGGQWVEVNWFTAWESPKTPHIEFSTVWSYANLLASDDERERNSGRAFFSSQFRDAVVLIGPVDPILQDVATTPLDDVPVPRVGLHGNLLQTIVSGKYIQRLPTWRGLPWVEYILVFGLAVAVSALAVVGGTRGIRYKLLAGVVLLGFIATGFFVFNRFRLVLPIAAPVGAAFTMSFMAIGWQLVQEEKQKSRIKNLFGTYVSPELVKRMVDSQEDPQLGGHDQEVTAYFSDIQAFSTFSEKLKSGPLVELMNEYLTACTEIIFAERGTLDKYIGDAVVAMFGAPVPLPDHAYRACLAAQRVQDQMAELRRKWAQEGAKWPEIVGRMQTRIGLNSGLVTVGNMGGRARFNYTMMGDDVNLAARMESGAKAYGVYTMVTEATKVGCVAVGGTELAFRFLDRIVVKGRSKPVAVYELVGFSSALSQKNRECLGLFEQGMARYFARDWAAAVKCFTTSASLEANRSAAGEPDETPSSILLSRCEMLRLNPPGADWDGVFKMTSK